jgi:opine dehydrogenase
MKIAVLGGGNGAFAAAGDLALAGHEIRLWRRDPQAVAEHRAAGGTITVKDHTGQRDAQITTITSDLPTAVTGADLIVCPTPAFAQPAIALALAPLLSDGQVVFLPPGSFGSVLFAMATRDAGNHAAVSFAETGTLPWLARKHGPYAVQISGRGKRLPTGVFPECRAESALGIIAEAFPNAIEPCGNALSAALMNAGPIIHPPLIMMNAGPIEHFERWDIHKEGTQPAIRRVTDQLDAERIAIREALGYGPPHFPLADHYARQGDEWMYGRGSHEKLTDSGDWHEHLILREHRYMLEDTRIGLSLLVSVAAMAGVETPLARGFLAIGSAICSEDFMRSGRTLTSLGLGGLDRAAMQPLLWRGFA